MTTLRDLIRQALPDVDDKPPHFAAAFGVKVWTVNDWFRKDRIPADQAERLVTLSDGRLTMRRLQPFIAPPRPEVSATYKNSPLWCVIASTCPEFRDAIALAAAVGTTSTSIRNYCEAGRIPYGPAKRLVELSGGRLRFDQLRQFIAEPFKRGPTKPWWRTA